MLNLHTTGLLSSYKPLKLKDTLYSPYLFISILVSLSTLSLNKQEEFRIKYKRQGLFYSKTDTFGRKKQ